MTWGWSGPKAPESDCKVKGPHCEQCGSIDPEDLNTGDQGYTACCNEPVTDSFYCRAHQNR